ncbi:MAG: two-component regulator propeller domain-containing protein [bacterium]
MAARCSFPWILLWLRLLSFPLLCPAESAPRPSQAADWGMDDPAERIGHVKIPGHHETMATAAGWTLETAGNGDRIGGAADEGYFVYTEQKGSWSLSGKLLWLDRGGGNPEARVGLMIRAGARKAASPAFLIFWNAGPGFRLGSSAYSAWRTAGSDRMEFSPQIDDPYGHNRFDPGGEVWFRVTRIAPNHLLFSEWSLDGEHWNLDSQARIEMGETAAYGIVIANAEDNEQLARARVTEIQLRPAPAAACREFGSGGFRPGEPVEVRLPVFFSRERVETIQVTETLPPGWKAERCNAGGVIEENQIVWSVPYQREPVSLTYRVLPPPEENEVALFRGTAGPLSILGREYLPPVVRQAHVPPGGHWRYWSTDDGLTESCGLCQIGMGGKIWIRHGAVDQISSMDGYAVHKQPSPGVWLQVFESRSHQLWSSYSKGIKLFKEGKWETYPIEGFDLAQVHILPGAPDRVLLCYPDRLTEFNAAQNAARVIQFATETGLGSFTGITASPDGQVLIAGNRGVAKIMSDQLFLTPSSSWREYLLPESLRVRSLDTVLEDETGRFYASAVFQPTGRRVFIHFDGKTWQLKYMTDKDIHAGWPGVPSSFWLWQSDAYYPFLDCITNLGGEIEEAEVQLPSLTSIQLPMLERGAPVMYESNHAFWVSLSPGIARYAPATWRTPEAAARLEEPINAICEDPQGRLWFTTFNKLILLENEEWTFFPLPEGYSTYLWEPFSLCYLKNGQIAIRTINSVLLTFDPETRQFQTETHPEGRRISWIFPRNDRTIWVQAESPESTRDHFIYRLEIYDGSSFRPFLDLGDRWNIEQLRYLYEDGQGAVWLGGMKDERVGLYRDGKYRTFGREYPGDSAMCIFPVDENRLWFTDRNSIYEYDGQTWRTVRTNLDAIPNLVKSQDGVIWVATWNGLYRYFQDSWIQNSVEEGLSSFCVLKVFEDSRRQVWAATSRGLSLYHPEADPDPPRTFLDATRNPNQLVPGSVAQFVFSGMDKWKYTLPVRLLYSHRIDSSPWSPFSEKTVATYTNLIPGRHQFQVRAMDRNWNIDPVPQTFDFYVLLPWYREPGFWLLLLITIAALGYAVSRHINLERLVAERTIHLREAHAQLLQYQQQLQSFASEMSLIEERDRRQIAGELHDRIGHGLAACQMLIQTIQRNHHSPETTALLQKTLAMLEQTIQDARTLTFEISPPVLYELGLEPALEWLAEQMEREHGMRVELRDDNQYKPLTEDARGVLFRAVRELLFNVRKHAKTSRAAVDVRWTGSQVRVTVTDHGAGFDFQALSTKQKHSFGLFSIRERIEYLGGRFECHSRPGEGTRIVLELPAADGKSPEAGPA